MTANISYLSFCWYNSINTCTCSLLFVCGCTQLQMLQQIPFLLYVCQGSTVWQQWLCVCVRDPLCDSSGCVCVCKWLCLLCANGCVVGTEPLFWEVLKCCNTLWWQPGVHWIWYRGLVVSEIIKKGSLFTSVSGCQPFLGILYKVLTHGSNL